MKTVLTLILTFSLSFAWASTEGFKQLYTAEHSGADVSLFFVQHANKIELTPKSKTCYQAKIMGFKPELIYFTDQPLRNVGRVNVAKFIQLWRKDRSVPNVVISAHSDPKSVTAVKDEVLSFKQPIFEPKQNTILATACMTDNTNKAKFAHKVYFRATLFYDPFNPGGTGGF